MLCQIETAKHAQSAQEKPLFGARTCIVGLADTIAAVAEPDGEVPRSAHTVRRSCKPALSCYRSLQRLAFSINLELAAESPPRNPQQPRGPIMVAAGLRQRLENHLPLDPVQ